MKIAIIANSAWYLHNFRTELLRQLRRQGHDPVAISPRDGYERSLREQGFEHIDLPLRPAGTSPLGELATLHRLRRLLADHRFELAFTYTPKVNIYTGLARKGLQMRHVPNVSGLGAVFASRSPLRPLVTLLYRLSFRHAHTVVFQNEDDRAQFVGNGLTDKRKTVRVPGSGVDLIRFQPQPPPGGNSTTFLFVGRVLRDKGVLEFIEAARLLRQEREDVRFQILGSTASDNPAAIPKGTVLDWQAQGWAEYLGSTDDVRPCIARADCVVLPSYREGVPRALLESSAMGRPCITTWSPGCKDVVDDARTGFLCLPADATSLLNAMRRFMELGDRQRLEMGRAAREKMECEFAEQIVLDTYLDLVKRIEIESGAPALP